MKLHPTIFPLFTILLFTSSKCSERKILSVKAYSVSCGIDYDRVLNGEEIKKPDFVFKEYVKTVSLSDTESINRLSIILNKESFIQDTMNMSKIYYGIDARLAVEIKFNTGEIETYSFDNKGRIFFNKKVYYPIQKLNDALCKDFDFIGCFCK